MEWVTNKKILLCLWGKAKDQQNWKKNLKEKQENYIFVLFKISCRHLKPSFSTSRAEWGGSVRTARRTWSSSWSVKFTAQTWTCSSTHWREWLTTFAACQKKRASVWSLIQCFYHVSTGPINHCMRYQPIRRMAGALISLFALDHSALVSPTDKRPRQMQHVDHQIWSWHGPRPSSEWLRICS